MPRVASSNGIRPEFRALAVIKLNVPVTPEEINTKVGTGNYAAKYISFLRKADFVFDVQKDGKKVVSYTLTKEPEKASDLRKAGPAVAAAVAVKPKAKNRSNLPTVKPKVVS